MQRIIKASWIRRRPPTQGYMQTLEAKREHSRQERIACLMSLVGSTKCVSGVVGKIKSHGAFVEIEFGTGFVHISEMSRNRIRHPKEVISSGRKVFVYVLAVDHNGRTDLSLIGPGKRTPVQTVQPIKATHGRTPISSKEHGSLAVQSVHFPTEVLEAKQPIRGFAELAAWWKLRENQ